MCGENFRGPLRYPKQQGSSPRVRGKLDVAETAGDAARLIPACAGKTADQKPILAEFAAHPRVCGENVFAHARRRVDQGSSPRVRGKPGGRAETARAGGLIPACAGKTSVRAPLSSTPGAHPRVCGENQRSHAASPPSRGSSPRVRGKLGLRRRKRWGLRLIPACAGKTIPKNPQCSHHGAHPRVCGENA